MLRLDAAIARPAVKQLGLATRKQLHDAGLSDEAIDDRVAAAVFRQIHRGVFLHANLPCTERTRLLAGVLACGEGAVGSHRSAAMVHAFDGVVRYRPEILVVGTALPRLSGATLHRTKLLDPADRVVVDQIPVTSRARTLLDLGAVLPFEVVEHIVQVACVQKQVSERDLLAVLDRVGRRGRNGTAVLRAVVLQSIPDERLASMLEHDLHQLIVRSGIPMPELQFPVTLDNGDVVYLDFAWPDWMLAVEADGHRWHATRKALERDHARSRAIQRLGWDHHRYGWNDVHTHAQEVIAELRALEARFASR